MKRLLALLALFAAVLWPAAAAFAHPLGNFTINRYSRIETAGSQVRIRYVLDMAEIPTFQEQPLITADYPQRKAAELAAGAHLTEDGQPVALGVQDPQLSFLDGQGGLKTLRLTAWFVAPLTGRRIQYQDTNYAGRVGWSEIVLPGQKDVSDELLSYPNDMLSSPLDQHAASFDLSGAAVGAASSRVSAFKSALEALTGSGGLAKATDGLTALVNPADLSLAVILFSLLAAVVLGALHALSPGHGKTIVAAYLVGTRGTPWQAVLLGVTVTATHTAGVFALGLATLFASKYIVPEQLYPWLGVASGGLVVAIGAGLFVPRLRAVLNGAHAHENGAHRHGLFGRPHTHAHPQLALAFAGATASTIPLPSQWKRLGEGTHSAHEAPAHDHTHDHPHDKKHEHTHPHPHLHERAHGDQAAAGQKPGVRQIIALGISGGLLPCPSALVVLLSAISLHRVGFGLVLIVAFSVGLASVLTGVGLLLTYAGSRLASLTQGGRSRILQVLPAGSALIVLLAGLAIGLQGLVQAGVLAL